MTPYTTMHLLGFTQFVCFSFDGQFTRKKYINFGIRYAFRSHDLFKLKLILKIKSYLYTQCAVCASVTLIRRRFSHMPKYPLVRSSLVHAVLFTSFVCRSRWVVCVSCAFSLPRPKTTRLSMLISVYDLTAIPSCHSLNSPFLSH